MPYICHIFGIILNVVISAIICIIMMKYSRIVYIAGFEILSELSQTSANLLKIQENDENTKIQENNDTSWIPDFRRSAKCQKSN